MKHNLRPAFSSPDRHTSSSVSIDQRTAPGCLQFLAFSRQETARQSVRAEVQDAAHLELVRIERVISSMQAPTLKSHFGSFEREIDHATAPDHENGALECLQYSKEVRGYKESDDKQSCSLMYISGQEKFNRTCQDAQSSLSFRFICVSSVSTCRSNAVGEMESRQDQSSTGSRVSVKESIKYICELITSLGVTGISPETLRLAKFNKLDSPRCLLRALHDIATLSSSAKPLKSQVWEDDEVLGFVKFNLALWGYPPHSPLFTRHCNSRHFLLALGWMISHCDLIAKGLTRRLQPLLAARNGAPLPDDFPLDMASSREAVVRARDAECAARRYVQRMIAATDRVHGVAVQTEMRVDQALMLYGQVRASQNAIAALRESKVKRLHDLEVAQMAAGVRHPHTPYELHVLQHPKKLDLHCEAIAAATAIEEETEACRKHEALFWQWMESVAHEELSHPSPGFDHLDLTGVSEAELSPAIEHLKTTLREQIETPSFAEMQRPDVPAEESIQPEYAKVIEAGLLRPPVFVYKPETRPVKATLRKEEENDPRTASSKLKRLMEVDEVVKGILARTRADNKAVILEIMKPIMEDESFVVVGL